MAFSKNSFLLLGLLLIGAVLQSTATPLPEEEDPSQVALVDDVEDPDFEIEIAENDDDYDEALGRNFVSKLVGQGVKKVVKNQVMKNVGKVVKKVVKNTVKGVGQGVKKVVKEGGKQVLKGTKKVVKAGLQGAKKVIKTQVMKNGKKILIKGIKGAGKFALESAAEMAAEALINKVMGNNEEEEEEEVEADEEEVGDDEQVEEEEEEEMDIFDYLASDDLCKCQGKKCVCCAQVPEYEGGCVTMSVTKSLWDATPEIRVTGLYGEKKAFDDVFPGDQTHKKCSKLPAALGSQELCVSSNGVEENEGLKTQCFNFEAGENSVVKCIAQTKNFKVGMNTE